MALAYAGRYRLRCEDSVHEVTLRADGSVDWSGHPGGEDRLDAEICFAALAGRRPDLRGCALARDILGASGSSAAAPAGEMRRLIADASGLRLARKLLQRRREAG